MEKVEQRHIDVANSIFDFIDPEEQADAVARTAPLIARFERTHLAAVRDEALEEAEAACLAEIETWKLVPQRSSMKRQIARVFTAIRAMKGDAHD